MMSAGFIINLLALPVLLVASAFFSSAESALFSLNPIQVQRLRRSHPRQGQRVEQLLTNATRLLSTILIGNTLVNFATVNAGFMLARRISPRFSELLAIPTMTLLLLLFAEVAPKRLALRYPEQLSVLYAPLLAPLVWLLSPLRILMEEAVRRIRLNFGTRPPVLTDDEFLTVVRVGEEQGVIDAEERSMMHGILRLADAQACDVMTPRVDLIGIDLDEPIAAQLEVLRTTPFRHVPVYRQSLDAIEGFLEVPRFLLDPDANLTKAVSVALFIPETAALDDLLITFQREHRRIACVVDEYGGTAGVITRGDILERITGDLDDEHHAEPPEIRPAGSQSWLVEGTTSLDTLNDALALQLEAEGADRISGWVSAQSGRFLRVGETLEAQGIRVHILKLRKHRIELLRLEVLPPPFPHKDNGNRDTPSHSEESDFADA